MPEKDLDFPGEKQEIQKKSGSYWNRWSRGEKTNKTLKLSSSHLKIFEKLEELARKEKNKSLFLRLVEHMLVTLFLPS